jgi:hypothetical protein
LLDEMTYVHSLPPNSVATGQEEAQKKKVDEWKAKFQSLTGRVNEAETARDVEMAKQQGLQLELEQGARIYGRAAPNCVLSLECTLGRPWGP